ncbi:tripartite tricarboxylate transporter substrate binding protein [Comamonadaceae bacterium G21597-S1]|nr:tripartite tricarboxylate transporter substrate binding protein [Comamonadaceae bacterium G21597-S1]
MTRSAFSRVRRSLAVWGTLAAMLPMGSALAQSAYPSRPITLIHPYAVGGPADSMARTLARQLETRLKQTVIVEGKPGGGATIGTGFVARAKPDGYTLLISTSAGHVVTPLMQKIPYDGVADFAFIAIVANQPNVVVAHPSLPASSLSELVASIKKEPGKLNYASAGTGGATHLGAEAVWQKAGVQVTHVPYAGAAPALKDLLGGQVQLGMLNLAATRAHIEKGTLKALAYGGAKRAAALPNVPTLAESGFAGAEVSTWYSLAAPKGTPVDILEQLAKVMAEINADPVHQEFLASQGAERLDLTPAQTTAFVKRDKDAMASLLGTLNLLEK